MIAQSSTQQTVSQALGALQTVLEYVGTVAFGISGALMAGRKRMDLAGVIVLGTIVAVGGGTTRDLLLGATPVFWIEDATFVVVGAVAAAATVPLFRTRTFRAFEKYHLVSLFDAAGMSLFVITGTTIARSAGANQVSAIIIGVIAGIGGGIVRDVLANEVPDVLTSGQYYATAAVAGATLYTVLLDLSLSPTVALWVPAAAIFLLRMGSLHFGWGIPEFNATVDTSPDH